MSKVFLSFFIKECISEWRKKQTIFSLLIFVAATTFLIYMLHPSATGKSFNVLFWITQLFMVVNAVTNSFFQESNDRFRYYYTIITPQSYFLSKVLYNILLNLLLTVITVLLFSTLLNIHLAQPGLFLIVSLTGSVCLTCLFTFLSALASKADKNFAIVAILGFPIATPVLMILSSLALKAISPVVQTGWLELAYILGLLNVLILLLGTILFPYLWKE